MQQGYRLSLLQDYRKFLQSLLPSHTRSQESQVVHHRSTVQDRLFHPWNSKMYFSSGQLFHQTGSIPVVEMMTRTCLQMELLLALQSCDQLQAFRHTRIQESRIQETDFSVLAFQLFLQLYVEE